ncbi:hypothetical protein XELAEV_18016502mg [Xenopus laevis]|uniref:Uncharacterized protein n=1 Tax=Xenopus laevis TaxID=8355 RepID=A0A974DKC2_XENLA|nr:hypothetical protein XELAEV_18016502mg [Xenopus laevis]
MLAKPNIVITVLYKSHIGCTILGIHPCCTHLHPETDLNLQQIPIDKLNIQRRQHSIRLVMISAKIIHINNNTSVYTLQMC